MGPLNAAIAGLGVTLGGLAAFRAATDAGAKFEKQMRFAAAVAGATRQEFEAMQGAAREMGEQTEFSATQAASEA